MSSGLFMLSRFCTPKSLAKVALPQAATTVVLATAWGE